MLHGETFLSTCLTILVEARIYFYAVQWLENALWQWLQKVEHDYTLCNTS